jgi:hypothetical protein
MKAFQLLKDLSDTTNPVSKKMEKTKEWLLLANEEA